MGAKTRFIKTSLDRASRSLVAAIHFCSRAIMPHALQSGKRTAVKLFCRDFR
jgi:hypothetical protein